MYISLSLHTSQATQCVKRRLRKRSLIKSVQPKYRPAGHMWPTDRIFKARELSQLACKQLGTLG